MKHTIDTARCQLRTSIPLSDTSGGINDHLRKEPMLYFVKNDYDGGYYGQCITLYGFSIVKETECYYFITTGQRVHKDLKSRTFAKTPDEALTKAMHRARNYLDILISRGQQVSGFLKCATRSNKVSLRELRDFEAIAKQFKDTDDIPSTLLKDHPLDELLLHLKEC